MALLKSGVNTTADRFPNTMGRVPDPYAKESTKSAKKTKKAVVKKKKKPVLIRLAQSRGPRYEVEVEFSSDKGKSFSNSKLAAAPLKHYRIKAKFNQFQAEPLLQGAKLHWIIPSGWRWIDGKGAYTLETLCSNPLEVIRIVKSPKTVRSSYVKVLVPKVYG